MFFNTVYAVTDRDNEIVWEEHPKLSWSDFPEIEERVFPSSYDPGENDKPLAFTWGRPLMINQNFTQVYSIFCQFQITELKAVGLFHKKDSWVHLDLFSELISYQNSVLNHEQGHFDIIEIHARKIESSLLNKIFPCPDNIYNDSRIIQKINEMSVSIANKAQTMHDEYDEETKHGDDYFEQKWWDGTIYQDLKNFNVENWQYHQNPPSPIKQIKNGIASEDVLCKSGYKRVVSNDSVRAACVTPILAEKLVERSWGKIVGVLRIDS